MKSSISRGRITRYATLAAVSSVFCVSSGSLAQTIDVPSCGGTDVVLVDEFGASGGRAFGDGFCHGSPGEPRFLTTVDKSAAARRKHGVDSIAAYYNLQGDGITVGVWDGGPAFFVHQQFELTSPMGSNTAIESRVTIGDRGDVGTLSNKPIGYDTHATHVTGTIASSGVQKRLAYGVAPMVSVVSYDWDDDTDEMRDAATQGVTISNHSYGINRGWEIRYNPACNHLVWFGNPTDPEDANFGRYTADIALGLDSKDFDSVVFDYPTLTPFVAAGNERGETNDHRGAFAYLQARGELPTGQFDPKHCVFAAGGTLVTSQTKRARDGGPDGWDTLSAIALAKNVITVGAGQEDGRDPTAFSSFGPPDDGRVKPDLIANGDDIISTWVPDTCKIGCQTSQTSGLDRALFNSISGTSMATPVAAGVGALLNEYAAQSDRLARTLYADEMKAVLVFSAASDERAASGVRTGAPTYRHGWGELDAVGAVDVLAPNEGRSQLVRVAVQPSDDAVVLAKIERTDARRFVRSTTVWIDIAGRPNGAVQTMVDDRSPDLVDDVDTYLLSPSGQRYDPWKLDPENPGQPATRTGPNRVDNVEVIDAQGSETGTWTLMADVSRVTRPRLDLAVVLGVVRR